MCDHDQLVCLYEICLSPQFVSSEREAVREDVREA